MLRGCRRGNQVLIFHSEAVLPLEPLVVSLYTATCRVRWQEHTNESVPDSMSHGTPVETALPPSLLTTTLLSDLLRGIDSCVPRGGYYRLAWRTFCVHPLSAACILSLMPSTAKFRESRRSTRVPLKVVITIEGGAESRTFDGETIVVSLHGALIATEIELSRGMKISIHVYVTDKRAAARVVFVDPKNPLHCGIELDEPRNIWGVPLTPDDWEETAALKTGH